MNIAKLSDKDFRVMKFNENMHDDFHIQYLLKIYLNLNGL